MLSENTEKKKSDFWVKTLDRTGTTTKSIAHSLFTWSWTKSLLYWLIISGGTMAELAFLVGAIWMSLNATVHPFILMFLNEDQTHYLSFLATSAYVALPELIVSLAVIVTIGHIKSFVYNRKNWIALVWTGLYGIPAVFFAGLSAYTIGESVANINFTMPEPFIIARALAGFLFAFTSLLYWQLGKPQEADRLLKKDEEIANLVRNNAQQIQELKDENQSKLDELKRETGAQIADLQKENQRLQDLIAQQNEDLETQKRQQSELLNALDKSTRGALQAYSQECQDWLMSGIKTVSAEQIIRFSGHSKRKVSNAIAAGKFQPSSRNKNLFLTPSVIEWLEQNPPDAEPDLYVVNG